MSFKSIIHPSSNAKDQNRHEIDPENDSELVVNSVVEEIEIRRNLRFFSLFSVCLIMATIAGYCIDIKKHRESRVEK